MRSPRLLAACNSRSSARATRAKELQREVIHSEIAFNKVVFSDYRDFSNAPS
jgi:hypothetical protein